MTFSLFSLIHYKGKTPLEYSKILWGKYKFGKFGKFGKDNGILIIIAKDDRKLRLSIGTGLEKTLPDDLCAKIIHDLIVPKFTAFKVSGKRLLSGEELTRVVRLLKKMMQVENVAHQR